jgi:hypothetical protein
MTTDSNNETPKPVGSGDLVLPSEIIIAELTGKPIRKLSRERLLQTGDKLSNKFGQELWTLEAFHPKGARVTQWPHGAVADYTWEALYGFYERVPPGDPALQNAEGETRRPSAPHSP